MQSKKRVSVLVVLMVISIIGISIVSASWWSKLFEGKGGEGLEGELPETKPISVGVNVTGCPSPPQIVFVSNVSTNSPNAHPADPTDTSFSFTAYYAGGSSGMKNPQGRLQATGEQIRENLTCSKVVEYSTYYANYTCTVKLYHYDGPGGATWKINTTIENTCNERGENSTKTFLMGYTYKMSITPLYLNWSSVTAGANLNIGADVPAPVVSNYGNVNMVQLTVNATDLVGKQYGSNLSSSVFTVDTASGTCLWSKNLTAEQNINSGASVSKCTSGTEPCTPSTPSGTLYFCLKEVLNVQTPDWFNATRQWKLNEVFA